MDEKPLIDEYNPSEQDKRAEEINQQIIDLELKLPNYGSETDEDELWLECSLQYLFITSSRIKCCHL